MTASAIDADARNNPGLPDGMTRYAACVEYDGSLFFGWQRQDGQRTVQGAVEQAISFVANHPVAVVCAGRTDSGVHASAQIIHFDSTARRSAFNWVRGVNTRLPEGVCIHWVLQVDHDFHARFKALRRRYRYIILNQSVHPGLFRNNVSFEYRSLQLEPMIEAAEYFVGRHDFSAFRAAACQSKNPVKTLYRLDLERSGRWLWLDLEADGFLHHMVRNIAGTLLHIGAGERSVFWAKEVLSSGDRRLAAATASASGLYLVGVDYDSVYKLPSPPESPSFW
ncbi:MAG: tRNA pseudouridine synthase A [marine bacterium B5-7]|nr:MAG: tRNA pseudouridine synthase A [marine bacterium B5-7]